MLNKVEKVVSCLVVESLISFSFFSQSVIMKDLGNG